jgi:hypothetical protein
VREKIDKCLQHEKEIRLTIFFYFSLLLFSGRWQRRALKYSAKKYGMRWREEFMLATSLNSFFCYFLCGKN